MYKELQEIGSLTFFTLHVLMSSLWNMLLLMIGKDLCDEWCIIVQFI